MTEGPGLNIDPDTVASQRSLFVLGLGLLAFLTSASPIGILAVAMPAGLAAIFLGLKEAGRAPKKSRARRLSVAGASFALFGFALAGAWVYVAVAFAKGFGGDVSIDFARLACTACFVLTGAGSEG